VTFDFLLNCDVYLLADSHAGWLAGRLHSRAVRW